MKKLMKSFKSFSPFAALTMLYVMIMTSPAFAADAMATTWMGSLLKNQYFTGAITLALVVATIWVIFDKWKNKISQGQEYLESGIQIALMIVLTGGWQTIVNEILKM